MAKTWANLISDVRDIVQDQSDTPRYSDAAVLSILNRGLQALATIRPEAFSDTYDNGIDDITAPEIVNSGAGAGQVNITANVSATVPLQFYDPLVYYTIGSVELIDDEFSDDSRAVQVLGQFKATVLGL